MSHIYSEIYKIVQSIPQGKVLTYGLISHIIGGRMSAQGVGWALKALGSSKKKESTASKKLNQNTGGSRKQDIHLHNLDNVPWQRVVNAQGGTSTHKVLEVPPDLQRHILETEGVSFDNEGKIDLNKYLWKDGIAAAAMADMTLLQKRSKPTSNRPLP